MAVGPCLTFERQAEFHPTRFLGGLAAAFERIGGRIHGHTHVVDVHDGRPCGVQTSEGHMVAAEAVLLATNSPSNTLLITMKMVPYRTFLVAMRASEEIPRALWWDTGDPYHYVRLVDDERGTLVLSGGGDYQTARKDEGERVFGELEGWTRARFPVGASEWRWSGQVLEPSDWLGFIGRLQKDGAVYVCTGDSGQGLTHGTICALLVGDLILGHANPWEEIYSPSRLTLGAAGAYVKDGAKIAINFLDWLLPGEVGSEARIPRGHGAVMRDGTKLIAVYRDADGGLERRSAVCTHAGCIVHWDSTARIWACPCHGSRFHPDGEVINGPATAPLARLDEAEERGSGTPAVPPTLAKKSTRARRSGTRQT
jgi:Rieske Fe-S protein